MQGMRSPRRGPEFGREQRRGAAAQRESTILQLPIVVPITALSESIRERATFHDTRGKTTRCRGWRPHAMPSLTGASTYGPLPGLSAPASCIPSPRYATACPCVAHRSHRSLLSLIVQRGGRTPRGTQVGHGKSSSANAYRQSCFTLMHPHLRYQELVPPHGAPAVCRSAPLPHPTQITARRQL